MKTSVLEFECTVTDGTLSSSDTVNISVHNTLTLDIVADAGDDKIVDENQTLSLDGSGSHDPENQPLNYSWGSIIWRVCLIKQY
ncbi:MAG: REJ domain-containing protein [Nitrosopumilus sp.]